jgi:hypothetical protein
VKRTKQLDLGQQVALPSLGSDVFTTLDQLTPSDAEKEELQHRLDQEGPLRNLTERFVLQIVTEQCAFAEAVLETLHASVRPTFHLQFDEVATERVVAMAGDRVLATYRPDLPKDLLPAIRLTIANIRKASRAQAAGNIPPSASN